MTRPERGHASFPILVLAVALALACVTFAVRAAVHQTDAPRLVGHYGPEGAARAVALIERLAAGLISLQAADGGFDLGPGGGYSYLIERISASTFATAALAHVRSLEPRPRVAGLDAALARGLEVVRKAQTEAGAIGNSEPKDRWSQVDATAAGLLAFGLAEQPQDAPAMRGIGRALARFARAGLRNGWTRALATMAIERTVRRGRAEEAFERPWRELVDFRQLKQQPADGRKVQANDWNVAEAISRVVLGLRKGADPFPAQVVLATLEDKPVWSGQSSDCQTWWMQAWLVSRSGSEKAPAWFLDLLRVLEEEAVGEDGTIQGGWYANTVAQTAGAIFALSEGFGPQALY